MPIKKSSQIILFIVLALPALFPSVGFSWEYQSALSPSGLGNLSQGCCQSDEPIDCIIEETIIGKNIDGDFHEILRSMIAAGKSSTLEKTESTLIESILLIERYVNYNFIDRPNYWYLLRVPSFAAIPIRQVDPDILGPIGGGGTEVVGIKDKLHIGFSDAALSLIFFPIVEGRFYVKIKFDHWHKYQFMGSDIPFDMSGNPNFPSVTVKINQIQHIQHGDRLDLWISLHSQRDEKCIAKYQHSFLVAKTTLHAESTLFSAVIVSGKPSFTQILDDSIAFSEENMTTSSGYALDFVWYPRLRWTKRESRFFPLGFGIHIMTLDLVTGVDPEYGLGGQFVFKRVLRLGFGRNISISSDNRPWYSFIALNIAVPEIKAIFGGDPILK